AYDLSGGHTVAIILGGQPQFALYGSVAAPHEDQCTARCLLLDRPQVGVHVRICGVDQRIDIELRGQQVGNGLDIGHSAVETGQSIVVEINAYADEPTTLHRWSPITESGHLHIASLAVYVSARESSESSSAHVGPR